MAMKLAASFQAFDACWAQLPDVTAIYLSLASRNVTLQFAGQRLIPIISNAFAHLAEANAHTADLCIRVWDTAELGIPLPSLDWQRIEASGYRGYIEGDCYAHYFEHIGAFSFLNMAENRAYYVVRDARSLPWWVSGSPLQVIISVWMRAHGAQLTHVAAVGDETSALLLAGKGGSGKTTTTLSCMIDGLNYLGEDYCLLTSDDVPRVYSVYQTAKWTPQTRRCHPEFEHFVANPSSPATEKSLLYYQEMFPDRIRTSLPVRAIVSLSVGEAAAPCIRPTDINTSLKNLSLSTVRQLPFFDAITFSLLREFGKSLPHFSMRLGTDRNANVALIKALLAGEQT